jgi:hypothetical protein
MERERPTQTKNESGTAQAVRFAASHDTQQIEAKKPGCLRSSAKKKKGPGH